MDRAIVLAVLLLVGLTWLLYKLIERLEPRGRPASAPQDVDKGASISRRKPIHQRLRQ